MREELERKLVARFPDVFMDYKGPASKTCMAWGMTCDDGWYQLVFDIAENIHEANKKSPYFIWAAQVKEKFGGLRFYTNIKLKDSERKPNSEKILDKVWFGYIWNLFRAFKKYELFWKTDHLRKKIYATPVEKVRDFKSTIEAKSYKICEHCGSPGKVQPGGCIKTLCDRCEETRDFRFEVENLKFRLKYLKEAKAKSQSGGNR